MFRCQKQVITTGPFHNVPNVIITPHYAWYSDISCQELREQSAKEVRSAIGPGGRIPQDLRNCVNREFLSLSGTSRLLHCS